MTQFLVQRKYEKCVCVCVKDDSRSLMIGYAKGFNEKFSFDSRKKVTANIYCAYI